MWMQGHVVERWGKVPAEELGGSLTLRRAGLSGLPHHQKPARSGVGEGWSIYPPYLIGVPPVPLRPVDDLLVLPGEVSLSRLLWALRFRGGRPL